MLSVKKINGILSTEQGYDDVFSLNESVRSNDDTFFAENTLLLVYVPSSSGSFRFDVKNVELDKQTLTVEIEQTNHPEAYTDDMSGWYVLISVKRCHINGCTVYDAVFAHD